MSSRTPDAHQVLKILGFGLALSSVDGPLCALLLNVYLGTNESPMNQSYPWPTFVDASLPWILPLLPAAASLSFSLRMRMCSARPRLNE